MNNKNLNTFGERRFDKELSYQELRDYLEGKLDVEEEKRILATLETNLNERTVLKGMELWRETENLEKLFPNQREIDKLLKKKRELEHFYSDNQKPIPVDPILVQLQEALEVSQDEREFISIFSKRLLQKRTLKEAYSFICNTAKEILNCRSASIFLYSKNAELERKYIAGFNSTSIPPIEIFKIGQGFVGGMIGEDQYGKIQWCNELSEDDIKSDPILVQYYQNYKQALYNQHGIVETINHVVVAPLNSFNRTAGVLRVINKIDETGSYLDPTGFSEENLRYLELIATISSITIAYLKNEKRIEVLNNVSNLAATLNTNQVLTGIANSLINESTLYSTCVIRILDPQMQYLEIKGSSFERMDPKMIKIKIGEGITGNLLYSDSYKIIDDLSSDPQNFTFVDWIRKHGLVSMISFPLKGNDRAISYGTLSVYTKFQFKFGKEDIKYLESFVQQVTIAVKTIEENKGRILLKDISDKLLKEYNIERLMHKVSMHLPLLTGFEHCRFLVKEKGGFRIISKHKNPFQDSHIPHSTQVAKVLEKNTQDILSFYDVPKAEILKDIRDVYLSKVKALVLIPITNAENELYGLIALAKEFHSYLVPEHFEKVTHKLVSKLNSDLLETIGNLFSTAITQKKEREKKEIILKKSLMEEERAKKEAQKAVMRIKSQYKEYKLGVKILNKGLLQETKPGSKAHLYARMIEAEFFVGKELLSKYLSKQSLRHKKSIDANYDSVFEQSFGKILNFIPEALSQKATITIKNDNGDSTFKFDKKQIQDIILTLVMNAIKHKKTDKKTTIVIESKGSYLTVKNDSPQRPEDIKKLKKLIHSTEYRNEGSTLFTIDKYFKENYQEQIIVDYKDDNFIVGLPFFLQN